MVALILFLIYEKAMYYFYHIAYLQLAALIFKFQLVYHFSFDPNGDKSFHTQLRKVIMVGIKMLRLLLEAIIVKMLILTFILKIPKHKGNLCNM